METFEHESLEVYQVAIEFTVLADKLTKLFPPARAHLADRLSADSTAVVVDIAKGAGELNREQMARYLHRRRRSVHASAALLDVARALKMADDGHMAAGRGLLLKLSDLLGKLCDRLEEAESEPQ